VKEVSREGGPKMKETRRLSRAQFLRLTGAGLAGSAFLAAQPYESAIAQQTTPPPIKLGAFVGWDRNVSDEPTVLHRWNKWASQQGKTPHMFADWFEPSAPVDQIRNVDNQDILALYDQLDAKSFMLSFNIRPGSNQEMLDLYNGALTPSGYTADEHVVMIGQRLAEFCQRDAGAFPEQYARVRYLHEFTGANKPWSAFDKNGLPKRFTLGHYRQLYRRWQLILAGGSVSAIDQKLAQITSETGDPAQPKLAKNINARRLKRAGYSQFGNGKLATNTKFGTVWCGQSAKDPTPVEDPTPDVNDYRNYYPGDQYVGEIGCDIFVGDQWTPNEQKFAALDDFYRMAERRNKPFAIPAWSRDNTPGDHPEWIEDPDPEPPELAIATWMEMETRSLMSFACNYEVLQKDQDYRLGNGEEPLALAKWASHATTERYEGS
jgi:hypothetical protein